METAPSLFAAMVAVIALLIALTAYAKVEERKQEAEKPKKGSGAGRPAVPMSDADRRRMAVQSRQHDNFMNYEGREQLPIDETTILADGGK